MMDHRERLLEQLAIDYDTTPQALCGGQNLFTTFSPDARKRVFLNRPSELLRVLVLGDTAVFRCADEALRAALEARFSDAPAAWLLSVRSLRALDGVLAVFSEEVSHQQLFFLSTDRKAPERPELTLRWYEGAALERFRGDTRFETALSFVPEMPDMLAVTAEEDGRILGLAGASRDAAHFWQIGIDVVPAARRRGIATALVAALRQEIIHRSALPFYGTAPSHIGSQRVALGAGFVPAWAELRSAPLQKEG